MTASTDPKWAARQARLEALEQAAKVADDIRQRTKGIAAQRVLYQAADTIRALKTKDPSP